MTNTSVQMVKNPNGDVFYHIPGRFAVDKKGNPTGLPCYHNDNGPAIINVSGYLSWWRFGKRHRFDGPAIVKEGIPVAWYFDGIEINGSKFIKWCEKNGIDLTTMTEEDEFLIRMKWINK